MRPPILVLGAGIVGVCTALSLQRDGHQVVLIDRQDPGLGCSYGNGGMIQCASVVPQATYTTLRSVPSMLFDRDQPLVIRWSHLPRLLPFLLRFLGAAAPAQVAHSAQALASIIPTAFDAYRPLLEDAGLTGIARRAGELYVYETDAAHAKGRKLHDIRRAHGVEARALSLPDLYDLEPGLARIFRHATYVPQSYQTLDPYQLGQGLFRHFLRCGGTFRQDDIAGIDAADPAHSAVLTASGRQAASAIVLALGADSGKFAARLGSPVPLISECGYHLMLPQPGHQLNTSVISGDYRFGILQMGHGIRLAGTAELAAGAITPNYYRATRLLPLAQRILPGLSGTDATPWMGRRPSTPDSLPVIGRSPRHPSVYFAFGHGHSGLTLGATTGRLIADLVADRPGRIDLTPFQAGRFRATGHGQLAVL